MPSVRGCVEDPRECEGAEKGGPVRVSDVPPLPCDNADASVVYGAIRTT